MDRGDNLTDQARDTTGSTTGSLTGVDLKHPPRGIENLGDVDKRFLAGAIRESYVQGLSECKNNPQVSASRDQGYRLADQWIGRNVPFLAGMIGDVGSSSTR